MQKKINKQTKNKSNIIAHPHQRFTNLIMGIGTLGGLYSWVKITGFSVIMQSLYKLVISQIYFGP